MKFTSQHKSVEVAGFKVVSIAAKASKLTLGERGPIAEYFSGWNADALGVTFYG